MQNKSTAFPPSWWAIIFNIMSNHVWCWHLSTLISLSRISIYIIHLEKWNSCLSFPQLLMNILSSASFPLGPRTDARFLQSFLFSLSVQWPWAELFWLSSHLSENCNFPLIKGLFLTPDHRRFSFHPLCFFVLFSRPFPKCTCVSTHIPLCPGILSKTPTSSSGTAFNVAHFLAKLVVILHYSRAQLFNVKFRLAKG